jgi:hypothetical protein
MAYRSLSIARRVNSWRLVRMNDANNVSKGTNDLVNLDGSSVRHAPSR